MHSVRFEKDLGPGPSGRGGRKHPRIAAARADSSDAFELVGWRIPNECHLEGHCGID